MDKASSLDNTNFARRKTFCSSSIYMESIFCQKKFYLLAFIFSDLSSTLIILQGQICLFLGTPSCWIGKVKQFIGQHLSDFRRLKLNNQTQAKQINLNRLPNKPIQSVTQHYCNKNEYLNCCISRDMISLKSFHWLYQLQIAENYMGLNNVGAFWILNGFLVTPAFSASLLIRFTAERLGRSFQ